MSWGLLHQCALAGLPLGVGFAVQAVVDRSGGRLALAGGLIAVLGVLIAVGDTMLHRTAVTNWITAPPGSSNCWPARPRSSAPR